MLEEKLSAYYLCNFNDAVQLEDLPADERLRQLWTKEELWTVEELESIVKRWQQGEKQEDLRQQLNDFLQLTFAFVQNNFTGPFDKLASCTEMLSNLKLEHSAALEQLKASGEEPNPNVKTAQLLLIAKELLDALIAANPTVKLLSWWRLRLICLHQHILDDLADSLYQQFKLVATDLRENLAAFGSVELQGLLLLELANGYLQFHRSDLSSQTLDEVCAQLQVELKVEGLLGLRTKHQQKALPQLCLKVTQQGGEEQRLPAAKLSNADTKLPQLLLLEDDTRRERILFVEPQDNEVMTLPSVLQALVLAKVKQLKRSQPKDRLADEQLEPYTQTLLYQEHGPLQVRQAALLLNCHQESGQRRTVERSWKQCEECVKLLDNTTHSLRSRLSFGFAASLQPKWRVQLQLVDLLRSLGMTKSALDICLQIHAWQQVIECYTSLELRHKAAEIIRQQLEKAPTALLYCLLGDAIDDPQCYEQAWLHSKQTSGKAQAYWGNFFYRSANYAEAIGHYETSLEINSLQEGILLRCGYCAIQLERWELAVKCYLAYTHLEPNGFESWNNLAKALIKLGDKQRAHRLLGEALKCNYNNWKVWENYMLVSVDTSHWEDAMRAYQRLGELKQHYLDEEVLTRIVYGIARQMQSDAASQAAANSLQRRIAQLLGQQCVQHGNEPMVWELAALVAVTPVKKAERLVKSYRAYTAKEVSWETKSAHAKKALALCLEAAELSLAAIKEHAVDESDVLITSQLSSSRLAATSCLNALKRASLVEVPKEQQAQMDELEQQLAEVTKILQQRMQRT
ncbi:tetratricopeptide repeat protein 27 [Drosophila sulfurigaster albostrigata]|uniref:tetratricopeptide repeat protein 27 n=1 Tax=Drosophila sulfurigaster albostrigata TaxID=89887 RepID=UPI002D21D518|nr:tetratricopeptide repeat protein 27 [Drosophila sulfurigaster albostrigata]